VGIVDQEDNRGLPLQLLERLEDDRSYPDRLLGRQRTLPAGQQESAPDTCGPERVL
jgi:hypothetical protein